MKHSARAKQSLGQRNRGARADQAHTNCPYKHRSRRPIAGQRPVHTQEGANDARTWWRGVRPFLGLWTSVTAKVLVEGPCIRSRQPIAYSIASSLEESPLKLEPHRRPADLSGPAQRKHPRCSSDYSGRAASKRWRAASTLIPMARAIVCHSEPRSLKRLIQPADSLSTRSALRTRAGSVARMSSVERS